MLVLMVITIVVVGPKDLPKVVRAMGHWMGKVRAMAGDFRASLDQLAREAELEELRDLKRGLDEARGFTPGQMAKDMLDPTGTFDAPAGPETAPTPGQQKSSRRVARGPSGPATPAEQGSPRPADAAMPRVEPEPPEQEDETGAPKTGQKQAGS